jgi:very-short-patch-repair endonuclease
MDPGRSNAEGVQLLRQYLQYIETGGTSLGDQVLEKPALNPFEVDVRDALLRRGLKLTPQYGTSGYWIDFAVQHPDQLGRYILAIECDGATYHSSQSARDRDRLRQEQLERQGWRFHRIWSTDWFHDKTTCTEKVLTAYHQALNDADHDQPATPARGTSDSAPPGHLSTAYQTAISRTAPTAGQRTSPRPWIIPGQLIDAYSDTELIELTRWIRSDDALRTEDELLREIMRELGFQKRGKNIVARLTKAIIWSAPGGP